MGVDVAIFVAATYSRDDLLFGEAVIELGRDYDAWEVLNSISPVRRVPCLQLPRASFSRTSDGARVSDDAECGYLFGDSYAPNAGFKVFEVADLAAVAHRFTEYNRKVVDFVCAAYPAHPYVLIWH